MRAKTTKKAKAKRPTSKSSTKRSTAKKTTAKKSTTKTLYLVDKNGKRYGTVK